MKKQKVVNKNFVVTTRHNEYKYVLLNRKSLIQLKNRIQSRDDRIATYETSKTSLNCFDDNNLSITIDMTD